MKNLAFIIVLSLGIIIGLCINDMFIYNPPITKEFYIIRVNNITGKQTLYENKTNIFMIPLLHDVHTFEKFIHIQTKQIKT